MTLAPDCTAAEAVARLEKRLQTQSRYEDVSALRQTLLVGYQLGGFDGAAALLVAREQMGLIQRSNLQMDAEVHELLRLIFNCIVATHREQLGPHQALSWEEASQRLEQRAAEQRDADRREREKRERARVARNAARPPNRERVVPLHERMAAAWARLVEQGLQEARG